MLDLLKQLYKIAESTGIKIISDDHWCQLLAWLLIFSGDVENIALDMKLRADIFEAPKRLNLYDAEIANQELLPKLQEYIKLLSEYKNTLDWRKELEQKYSLNLIPKLRQNNCSSNKIDLLV